MSLNNVLADTVLAKTPSVPPIMSRLVSIRSFPNRSVAEVARAVLQSHGIAATVSAADAGYDVSFATGGAKLLVEEHSVESAEEILADAQEVPSAPEDKVSESTPSARWPSVLWIVLVLLVIALVALAF